MPVSRETTLKAIALSSASALAKSLSSYLMAAFLVSLSRGEKARMF
jgi:hypothetical protein